MTTKKSAAARRRNPIWVIRPTGLDPAKTAAHWTGDTAARVMKDRLKGYRAADRAKAEKRARAAAARAAARSRGTVRAR